MLIKMLDSRLLGYQLLVWEISKLLLSSPFPDGRDGMILILYILVQSTEPIYPLKTTKSVVSDLFY